MQPSVRIRTSDPAALEDTLTRHGHHAVQHDDGHWTVPHARVDEIGVLASAAGVPILELTAQEGTLEQAYLDLTAAETEFTAQPQEA